MFEFFKTIFKKERPLTISDEVIGEEPSAPVAEADPSTGTNLEAEPITQPSASPMLATAPLSSDMLMEEMPSVEPHQFVVGTGHSVGMQREHNEDAMFAMSTTLVTDSRATSFGLFVIADGMGGHQHGEVASGLAARAVSSHILRKIYIPMMGLRSEIPDDSLQEIMQEAVMEAHRAILKDATGGGTTLTAALIIGELLMIAHVGDSRAYACYIDGSLRVLTRDHSLVKRLEELGQITSAEAAVHPQRNVLYRALGQGEPFEPDVNSFPIPEGGYLMLCSDGLWGVATEKELVEILRTASTPEIACQKMVAAANQAGGPDNISVVLVKIPH